MNFPESAQKFRQARAQAFKVSGSLGGALPNHERTPAKFAERPLVDFVARGVAVEFLQPEGAVLCRRRAIPATTMPMPETSVNEDDGSVLRQHDVGLARQFLSVKAKSKAQPMEQRANTLFWRGVLAANPAHVPTAALLAQSVAHGRQTTPARLNLQFIPRRVGLSCGSSSSTGLADPSVNLVVTDPPFFDNVHYSELADFFFAWQQLEPSPFTERRSTTRHLEEVQDVSAEQFAAKLRAVFAECSRVLKDDGLLVFTYHHSRMDGWTALADAVLGAGLSFVNCQPLKAEMSVAAPKAQAKEPIQLDVVLVCRKQAADTRKQADAKIAFQRAIAHATTKAKRLNDCGLTLSVNDRRVVLISQFLIETCAGRSATQLVNVLSASLTDLDLAAMRLLESPASQSAKQPKQDERQLALLEKTKRSRRSKRIIKPVSYRRIRRRSTETAS